MAGLERLYGGSDPGQVWSFIILYTMFFGAVLSGGFAAGFFIFQEFGLSLDYKLAIMSCVNGAYFIILVLFAAIPYFEVPAIKRQ